MVNRTTQADLLFETSCSFSGCGVASRNRIGRLQTGPKTALYSLTESARSPFHAEPAQPEMRPLEDIVRPCGKSQLDPNVYGDPR